MASAAFATQVQPRITLRDGVFRVQSASPEATLEVRVEGPGELPPLLGTTSRANDELVFKPRFPLQPGLRYRAVHRDPRLQADVTEVFAIPKDAAGSVTRVDRIDPTSDVVPENLLKLYLNFSAPMSRGEAYRWIRLLDAKGKRVELPFLEIEQELWDREARRLTLLFDPGRVKRDLVPRNEEGSPLRAGESYTLVIERGFPDAHGNPIEGETRKTLRVGPPDYDPPRTRDWRLTPPRPGGREPLVVTFPETLDRALLDRVLDVLRSSGERVAGEATVDAHATRWSFTPSDPWKAGDYTVRVASILEDLAGNSLKQKFEVGPADRSEGPSRPSFESVSFRIRQR